MLILLTVVFFTLFISANCSLYEAVLYSTRIGTLESAKTRGPRSKLALRMLAMKKSISKPIAAILILNTLANTAGATIAGMVATQELGSVWVPVFSILFTLGILFLSEIIPKTVGAVHWRAIWPSIVYPVKLMELALYPAILVTEKLSRVITSKKKGSSITEDEILALVHLGAREGEISRDESQMVKNIISLEDKTVKDIMTPRRIIFSLDGDLQVGAAYEMIANKGTNRIPLYEGDRENIIGYLIVEDVIAAMMEKKSELAVKALRRPISFVPEETNCLSQLTSFLKRRRHIAIVSDEFGGVAGLITLEDLIETVLGHEIVDETDQIVDLQESARKQKPDKDGI